MDSLLVDTGFLVALGRRDDPLHKQASAFLRDYSGKLLTAAPIIVESCFFFGATAKVELLNWVRDGGLVVADVPAASYADLAAVVRKYADRDIDLADAALVWLANESGMRRILTTDESDFSVYRLKTGKRFEVVSWMD